jgi:DNA-binding NtrC family response regulator
MPDRKKILIVDDEQKILSMYTRMFIEAGYLVRWARNATDATNAIIREQFDLILLDIRMSQIDGKTMYEIVQEYDPAIKVIVVSAYPIEKQKQLIPQAEDYHDKSHDISSLIDKVQNMTKVEQ